jgi:hypothetical protein
MAGPTGQLQATAVGVAGVAPFLHLPRAQDGALAPHPCTTTSWSRGFTATRKSLTAIAEMTGSALYTYLHIFKISSRSWKTPLGAGNLRGASPTNQQGNLLCHTTVCPCHSFKGTVQRDLRGSKVVSINRSSFNLTTLHSEF